MAAGVGVRVLGIWGGNTGPGVASQHRSGGKKGRSCKLTETHGTYKNPIGFHNYTQPRI